MRIFLDTEFIEDGQTIDLVSLGAVDENNRTFYAEIKDIDWSKAHPWVIENVKPHLLGGGWEVTKQGLALEFHAWVSGQKYFDSQKFSKPEFWGWYSAYDWVVICQLYGTMLELPRGWPRYINDLRQFSHRLGNPKVPQQSTTQHFALEDAQWNKQVYDFLCRCELEKLNEALKFK